MADVEEPGTSETTPLMLAPSASALASTRTSQHQQPPSLASGARPKPPRSVTFNANPVSETYEAGPRYSPQPRMGGSSSERWPHPINTSSSSSAHGLASGLGGPFSATGAPVLSSLNSKLRRRNSHGSSMPLPGGGTSPHAFHAGAAGRFLPGMSYPAGGFAPKVGPQRSTKNAQKLKLLPNPDPTGDDDGAGLEASDQTGRDVYSQYMRIKDPSARRDAARLGKADRERLPRVTAYCTANKYQMDALMRFLRGRGKTRGANPRLIDECIYTPYNYGFGLATTPGGNAHGHHEVGGRENGSSQVPSRSSRSHGSDHPRIPSEDSGYEEGFPLQQSEDYHHRVSEDPDHRLPNSRDAPHHGPSNQAISESPVSYHIDGAIADPPSSPMSQDHGDPHTSLPLGDLACPPSAANNTIDQELDTRVHTPEVFLFDYGVVVIWGMSETHEEKFLKELEKFEVEKLAIDEVQTELFNFYYTREYQPRIYNDFITLRDKANYRTKLAISHGLAQSVKTSLFEELVATTIEQTKDIPSEIALTGTIALNRSEINMQIGELFILRINIHQSGSVLDTPELFWVEPQLEPVYQAVRSYLEMDRRVKVLTSRVQVIGDLLAVLKDQLSLGHGEKLEWIVIILIAAEILVAAINIYVDLFIVD